jgi:hypothetical protein
MPGSTNVGRSLWNKLQTAEVDRVYRLVHLNSLRASKSRKSSRKLLRPQKRKLLLLLDGRDLQGGIEERRNHLPLKLVLSAREVRLCLVEKDGLKSKEDEIRRPDFLLAESVAPTRIGRPLDARTAIGEDNSELEVLAEYAVTTIRRFSFAAWRHNNEKISTADKARPDW